MGMRRTLIRRKELVLGLVLDGLQVALDEFEADFEVGVLEDASDVGSCLADTCGDFEEGHGDGGKQSRVHNRKRLQDSLWRRR